MVVKHKHTEDKTMLHCVYFSLRPYS